MKRTDKEIVSAMEYIKSQHNGELPYVFGTFDCAKMMAKYLLKQSSITEVVQVQPEVCGCGNTKRPEISHCETCVLEAFLPNED